MYDFSAPLFWFKFVFLLEILIAESLIIYRMKRKPHFLRRALITFFCLIAFTFGLPVPVFNAVYSSLLFISIFAATLAGLKFCFDEPWGNIIFCGFFSYNEQHISFQLYSLLCFFLGIDANSNIYGSQASDLNFGFQVLLFLIPHVAIYLVSWALLRYREYQHNDRGFYLKNFKVLLLSIVIVFVNVVLNAFVVYDLPADIPAFVKIIIIFYNVCGCVLALIMQVSIVGKEEVESELKFVEELRHKNEQIYELSKVNVDFINMKCHDLRHRIRNVREKEFPDENELEEIEQALDIYDGILKTGNEVLDVILSEESIFCHKNNIKLLCNIDGAKLDFIRQAELYSIFQNAIHNAVDAVIKIEETEKRIIRITVKRVENMISVHMENYIRAGEKIELVNGYPVSQHADKNIHGFGIRSMRASVEKYGGFICIDVKNDIFYLDIMIPVKEPAGVSFNAGTKEAIGGRSAVAKRAGVRKW